MDILKVKVNDQWVGIPAIKGDKGDKGDTGDPAPAADITSAVDAWLGNHISNPDSPPLDRTLSSAVSAAPADMVGDLKQTLTQQMINIGFKNMLGNSGTDTYRGVTVKLNGNRLLVDGTATGNANFKITGNMAHAVGVSGWVNERLPVIAGRKYSVALTVLSGSATLTGTSAIYVYNGSGESTVPNPYGNATNGLITSPSYTSEIVADANNFAFITFYMRSGNVYNNVLMQIDIIDITELNDFQKIMNDYSEIGNIKTYLEDHAPALQNAIFGLYGKYPSFSFNGTTLTVDIPAGGAGRAFWNQGALTDAVTSAQTYTVEHGDFLMYNTSTKNIRVETSKNNFDQYDIILLYNSHGVIIGQWAAYYAKQIADEVKQATTLSEDMLDRKVNSVLPFTDMWHYSEIAKTSGIYTNEDDENTTYYLVTVPLRDTKGNIIPIIADWDDTRSPMAHAQQEKTSLTANSGMTVSNTNGAVIKDGVVVHESDYTTYKDYLVYVGFDANRGIHEYTVRTSSEDMISDGIKNACIAYYRLVTNGVVRDVSDIGLAESNLEKNPRMAMFTKSDGSVCFLACDGREETEAGLTPEELGDLMVSLGAVDGWNLDGGGSTSLSVNGVKQNKHIDGNGTVDRMIHVTWNVPGIRPDYLIPQCNKSAEGTYRLKCTVANGVQTYEWVKE